MVRVIVSRSLRKTTMAVATPAGKKFTLYSTPTTFEHGEVARFGAVEREGLKPITSMIGPGLRTLSFSHRIGAMDYKASIEHVIIPLTRLARDGQRVRFVGGSSQYEQGVWWRIIDLSVSVEQRAANNHISRATLSWSLEEAGTLPPTINKVTPKPRPAAPAVKKASTRTYRVVPGDTLWAISARFLGNPLRWQEIFRANVKVIGGNPNYIRPGQVFKLPAR